MVAESRFFHRLNGAKSRTAGVPLSDREMNQLEASIEANENRINEYNVYVEDNYKNELY